VSDGKKILFAAAGEKERHEWVGAVKYLCESQERRGYTRPHRRRHLASRENLGSGR